MTDFDGLTEADILRIAGTPAKPVCPHCGSSDTEESIFRGFYNRTVPNAQKEQFCKSCEEFFIPQPVQLSIDAPPFDSDEVAG